MKTITLLLLLTGITGTFSHLQARDTVTLTLESALEIAYRQSPQLMQSKRALQQSERNLITSKARLKPTFSLSTTPFSYNRNNTYDSYNSTYYMSQSMSSNVGLSIQQDIKPTGGTLRLTENLSWQEAKNQTANRTNKSFSNNLRLSYTQPLFRYNSVKMDIEESELTLEESKYTYTTALINLESQVTSSFYNVYKSYNSVETAKDALKKQEETYNMTKIKVDAKLIAPSDLFQQEIDLANKQDALSSAIDSYATTKDNFKKLLGIELETDILVLLNVETNPIEIDPDVALQHAIRQRLDLRRLYNTLKRQKNSLIRQKAENKFSGDLSLNVGITGNDKNIEDVFKNQTNSQDISLSLSIPIWDWGVRRNNIIGAELSVDEAVLNIDEAKKDMAIEIRDLCRSLPRLLKQIELSKQSMENANRKYEIELVRYSEGQISAIQLRDYQDQLTQTQESHTNAIIEYKNKLLEIKIATLWDFENNISILPAELIK